LQDQCSAEANKSDQERKDASWKHNDHPCRILSKLAEVIKKKNKILGNTTIILAEANTSKKNTLLGNTTTIHVEANKREQEKKQGPGKHIYNSCRS